MKPRTFNNTMKPLYLFLLLFLPGFMRVSAQLNNPVIARDFPDPTVMRFNGAWYVYATQGKSTIQAARSTDLQHWEDLPDAMPQKPSWGNEHFWAPHVLYDARIKKYVMFYSAESTDEKTGKCLGVAFADKPEGPFKDKGSPLICGETFVNIDPYAFRDPATGKNLLIWGSGHQPIRIQEMNSDWSDFLPGSKAKDLLFPDQETRYTKLIEGAWIDQHKGYYYLYYSGDNCCGDKADYAVLVARSKTVEGPYVTFGAASGTGKSAILESKQKWLAPGHNSILHDKGKTWIAFHAIEQENRKKGRQMLIAPLFYRNGWPQVSW
ncbi:glycoside hydrolase [Pedobacter yulinensis]|uniref:Glycoside hydrolase n=1 Tax=Pedobacter yulinensis TaxID=2126353 RepID=A0A2T3HKQ0_9SPHI|nr:glycoside hydrolase family 43 protein [Pedobacter yulinensis]PST83022.1 glycoside hydrolase [Pedobacter yulinensis]